MAGFLKFAGLALLFFGCAKVTGDIGWHYAKLAMSEYRHGAAYHKPRSPMQKREPLELSFLKVDTALKRRHKPTKRQHKRKAR